MDEMTLYLDTHPYETEAIDYLTYYVRRKNQLMKEYAYQYGPLTIVTAITAGCSGTGHFCRCHGTEVTADGSYERRLQYPVNIKDTDAKAAIDHYRRMVDRMGNWARRCVICPSVLQSLIMK